MEHKKYGKAVSLNVVVGVLFKLLTLVLSLANRTVFVQFLSEEYLGVNGLYSNILSALAMADLGVNAVMIYILYEPLVNQNKERIAALVNLFRKIYFGIAGVVFFLGIAIVPILPYIVSENILAIKELILYYLLFLINSVCSYLGAYKATLLIADQKSFYVNIITFTSHVFQLTVQIAALFFFGDYTVYLAVAILGTLINNYLLSRIADWKYPYLKLCTKAISTPEVKSLLIERTKAVFLYRIGGTIIDSTDNILISVLSGTVMVGYYSNYSTIATNLFGLLNVVSQACMTGIGNYSIKAGNQERKQAFCSIQLIYFFLGSLVMSGMLCAMNDFMRIWIRQEQYILNQVFVFVLASRIFLDIIVSPNWVFREALGMFNEARNIRLWSAGLNIVFSVIMGKLWGLPGIVGATTIAKLLTTVWYEPRLICRGVFKESTQGYWKLWSKMLVVSAISVGLSYVISVWFVNCMENILARILLKCAICVGINVCFFGFFILKEKTFTTLAGKMKGISNPRLHGNKVK